MRIKHFLILAAAAGMALSCISNFEATPTQPAEIGFGTWSESLTKARAVGSNEFAAGDKFYVSGFNALSGHTGAEAVPFKNVPVTASGTTTLTWTYSPKRFWNSNTDYYTFYAFSPSEETGESPTASNTMYSGNFMQGTYMSTDRTFSGSNNDILVADKKVVEKADYGKEVVLNFRHTAAKFDLKVRKAPVLADATVNITGISLENIINTGVLNVTGYNASDAETNPNSPIFNWSDPESGSSTTTYTDQSGVTVPTNAISEDHPLVVTATETANSHYLINGLIVRPQTFATSGDNRQQLKISYKLITEYGNYGRETITFTDKTYYLTLFDDTDFPTDDDSSDAVNYNGGTHVTGWENGVHYTYIITIDASAITFSATMTPWTTGNAYYYLAQ